MLDFIPTREHRFRFLRLSSGATAVELAFVLPVFLLLFLGIFDFGFYNLTRVTIASATANAGRAVAIGTTLPGKDRVDTAIALIRQSQHVYIDSSKITISLRTISGGNAVEPDLCLNNGSNSPPTTGANCPNDASGNQVFIEVNGIPGYQGSNAGNAGDIVEIRAIYPWQMIFPLFRGIVGNNGVINIQSSVVVKNEPF